MSVAWKTENRLRCRAGSREGPMTSTSVLQISAKKITNQVNYSCSWNW